MIRRPRIVFAAALAVVALASFALEGCTQQGSGGPPSAGPSASSVPSAAATPAPTPTPTFVPDRYTCQSILPPATLAVFQSKAAAGFSLQKDYVQRVHNFDPVLSLFDDYHGILCQWAYEGATRSVDYGFSPITAAQAGTEQAELTKNGYAPTAKDHGVVFANADAADFPDNYLFIDGYWFYASSPSLLDLIVENVFSVPDQ
jgi:hypothetical protein